MTLGIGPHSSIFYIFRLCRSVGCTAHTHCVPIWLKRRSNICVIYRCETPQFISPDMWPKPGWVLHLGYDAEASIPSIPIRDTHELRQRLVETWAEFQHIMMDDAIDRWRKKTGSLYPCRRWLLLTLTVTLLAWHSSWHTSQPALFRATNVWRETIVPSIG